MHEARLLFRRWLGGALLAGSVPGCHASSERAAPPKHDVGQASLGLGEIVDVTTTDLLVSEYVEGASNDKAIELYNGTAAAIDLSAYALAFHFNGNATATTTIPLQGTIAPGETYVLTDDDASPTLLARADQTSTASFFNGDDAVALLRDGTPIDVIGQIGFDPGNGWTSNGIGTRNQVLRRRPDVFAGDPDGSDAFDPAREWVGAAQDDFTDLGRHEPEGEAGPTESSGDVTAPLVLLHDIQGPTERSPLVDQRVTIEAVVVADFQHERELSGFFVQEEDTDADADPTTSEGLFVFARTPDVHVGDRVRVVGTVIEYYDRTELGDVGLVEVLGTTPLPTPAAITLPWPSSAAIEAFEGMAVVTTQPLVVTDTYDLGRYGQVMLAVGDRLPQPTQVATPGAAAAAIQADNALRRVLLDDASNLQNPDPVAYPAPGLAPNNTLRAGARVTQLRGVLDYSFGEFKIRPTAPPAFDLSANPRRPAPTRTGNVRVASLNVLNFFNGDGSGAGFPTSRGASSLEEFERQSAKIVAAILELDADIIGLLEIENDGFGPQSAIADLTGRVNARAPAGVRYGFVDPGVPRLGSDEIAVALLYRTATVQPAGAAAILNASVDPRFDDALHRPSLAQTFVLAATGDRLTLAVNHLKSKGSICDTQGDPDLGDGQGNCSGSRTRAAVALADWLASDPTGSGDADRLIVGDLNAYALEDPILALGAAGYVNLAAEGTSYGFDGQWGTLDYALASPSLAARATLAMHWSINADEPRVFDYNVEFKSVTQVAGWYEPSPFRSSDHDPVLVDFDLPSALTGTASRSRRQVR